MESLGVFYEVHQLFSSFLIHGVRFCWLEDDWNFVQPFAFAVLSVDHISEGLHQSFRQEAAKDRVLSHSDTYGSFPGHSNQESVERTWKDDVTVFFSSGDISPITNFVQYTTKEGKSFTLHFVVGAILPMSTLMKCHVHVICVHHCSRRAMESTSSEISDVEMGHTCMQRAMDVERHILTEYKAELDRRDQDLKEREDALAQRERRHITHGETLTASRVRRFHIPSVCLRGESHAGRRA